MKLSFCSGCGEGVTNFCRGNESLCTHFNQPRNIMFYIEMKQSDAQSLQRMLSEMNKTARQYRAELRHDAGELWKLCDKADESTRPEFEEMNQLRDIERLVLRHEKQIDTLIRALKGA